VIETGQLDPPGRGQGARGEREGALEIGLAATPAEQQHGDGDVAEFGAPACDLAESWTSAGARSVIVAYPVGGCFASRRRPRPTSGARIGVGTAATGGGANCPAFIASTSAVGSRPAAIAASKAVSSRWGRLSGVGNSGGS
jgi:hypothetical protein